MGITEGIAERENRSLTKLILSGNLSNDTLIAIALNCPNLKILSLHTSLFFSESLLPLIFDRLKNLEDVHIGSLNSESKIDMFESYEVEQKLQPPEFDENSDVTYLKKLKIFSISGFSESPLISLAKLSQLSDLRESNYCSYNQVIN